MPDLQTHSLSASNIEPTLPSPTGWERGWVQESSMFTNENCTTVRDRKSASRTVSEVKLQVSGQHSLPGQVIIESQRVQAVVAVCQIEQSHSRFQPALQKAPPDIDVELPKLLIRSGRSVVIIGLRGPDAIELAEKSARMIIVRVEIQLMQGGSHMWI